MRLTCLLFVLSSQSLLGQVQGLLDFDIPENKALLDHQFEVVHVDWNISSPPCSIGPGERVKVLVDEWCFLYKGDTMNRTHKVIHLSSYLLPQHGEWLCEHQPRTIICERQEKVPWEAHQVYRVVGYSTRSVLTPRKRKILWPLQLGLMDISDSASLKELSHYQLVSGYLKIGPWDRHQLLGASNLTLVDAASNFDNRAFKQDEYNITLERPLGMEFVQWFRRNPIRIVFYVSKNDGGLNLYLPVAIGGDIRTLRPSETMFSEFRKLQIQELDQVDIKRFFRTSRSYLWGVAGFGDPRKDSIQGANQIVLKHPGTLPVYKPYMSDTTVRLRRPLSDRFETWYRIFRPSVLVLREKRRGKFEVVGYSLKSIHQINYQNLGGKD